MRTLRTLALLLLAVSLMTASVANAAMPCCCMGKEIAASQASADEISTMPCHETADDIAEAPTDCAQCGCLHGISSSALPDSLSVEKDRILSPVAASKQQPLSLCQPQAIFQPPRHSS